MKHITTTSFSLLCVGLGLAFSSLTSCKQEPPKLFDESALDRQEALSKELLTELTSSQHGWIQSTILRASRPMAAMSWG